MSIKYKGDLTCAMSVGDLNESIVWYKDILGFELIYKLDEMGWCEMKTAVPEVKGGATLVFGVKDIDAARSALEKKGVRFDGPTQTIEGVTKLATFYDLDGNKLMFSQSLNQQ